MLLDLLKQFGAIGLETTAPPVTLTRCLTVAEMDAIKAECSLPDLAHVVVAQRVAIREFKPDPRLLSGEWPLGLALAAACREIDHEYGCPERGAA